MKGYNKPGIKIALIVLCLTLVCSIGITASRYVTKITLPSFSFMAVKPAITYVDFTVTEDNRDMIGYTDETTDLVIPATFQSSVAYDADGDGVDEPAGTWYKVTAIGDYTFASCYSLENVTILEGVVDIGECAFNECTSLTSVTIPDSVRTIGFRAFQDCVLKSVIIPHGVETIEDESFAYCTNLTSVVIPDSVKTIGSAAFINCGLKSVTIPHGVETIGENAFLGSDLTSVVIPDSVKTIGFMAFASCYYLTDINYAGTQEQWNAIAFGEDWDIATKSYTIHYNYVAG